MRRSARRKADRRQLRSKRRARSRAKDPKRWSRRVMETSNALDLERGVFKGANPTAVARSLKRSAERSERRKSDPYRSAMSMLTFYINRAGKNLPKRRLHVLEQAKDELRAQFHRPRRTRGADHRRAAPRRGGPQAAAAARRDRALF